MERALDGLPAAPGTAVGRARVLAPAMLVDREPLRRDQRQGEVETARRALDRAAAEIESIAAKLRRKGRDEEAEIVETGVLIARDPSLQRGVLDAVFDRGVPAAAAILDSAEAQAELVAAIDDARLAERADDIRSVGRRAAGFVGRDPEPQQDGAGTAAGRSWLRRTWGPPRSRSSTSASRDRPRGRGRLGPRGDRGALAGIPMVVGVSDGLLSATPGSPVVVDGSDGSCSYRRHPEVEAATLALSQRTARRAEAIASRELPWVTDDGHSVRVLANVSGAAELSTALEAGAEGVGLLRTELAFLVATEWPSEEEHRRMLALILAQLEGDRRPSASSTSAVTRPRPSSPESSSGESSSYSITLPRSLLSCGRSSPAREAPSCASCSRWFQRSLRLRSRGRPSPPRSRRLRRRTPSDRRDDRNVAGVDASRAIASEVDYLSIGTNDLTHSTLNADRFPPQEARTHNPRVCGRSQP